MNLEFRVPAARGRGQTTSGDVHVALPDTAEYDVDLDTGSGDPQIGVRTDPESPRKISRSTNSGDASVGYGN